MDTLSIEIAAQYPDAIAPHVVAALERVNLSRRTFLLASDVGGMVELDLVGAGQQLPYWSAEAFRGRADRPETRDEDDHIEALAAGIARRAAARILAGIDRERAAIAWRLEQISASAHARMRNADSIRALRGELAAVTSQAWLYDSLIERHGRNIIDILARA
ncbi:hypothetical protein [Azospirillum picis]|uniref:Uncharacterized protein n=1 Tax=Azospirillum picis TaxID=488438 RepID=A0ABU0MT71_9PROT|nr:hypothetical protein [Azospirillum picis]MBP2302814.1 hypothetical protein [Azospirillum picis]MDQ0536524.1 hypothetical protein [Azospirillum picis]